MKHKYIVAFFVSIFTQPVLADSPVITDVQAEQDSSGLWQFSVTLRHADTGWDHYANAWRIVDGQGNVLAERILHHPHVHEQPFTRSLGRVEIPDTTTEIYVIGQDSVHGLGEAYGPLNLSQK